MLEFDPRLTFPRAQVGDVELLDACTLLAQSLKLREKYMEMSLQRFYVTTKRHLQGSYGPIRTNAAAKNASRGEGWNGLVFKGFLEWELIG